LEQVPVRLDRAPEEEPDSAGEQRRLRFNGTKFEQVGKSRVLGLPQRTRDTRNNLPVGFGDASGRSKPQEVSRLLSSGLRRFMFSGNQSDLACEPKLLESRLAKSVFALDRQL
jgi:hypothetical protein